MPSSLQSRMYCRTSGSSAVMGERLKRAAAPICGPFRFTTSGLHASEGQSSKPSVVELRMANTNRPPTISTLVMNGSGARMYCWRIILAPGPASKPSPSRCASSSPGSWKRRMPSPLPPWSCFVMNGPPNVAAASSRCSLPMASTVRGVLMPCRRSIRSWRSLLISSSNACSPLTTRCPRDSSQNRSWRASSTVWTWPRVCDEGLMRLIQMPSGGGMDGSMLPSFTWTRRTRKPSLARASWRGGIQRGFS